MSNPGARERGHLKSRVPRGGDGHQVTQHLPRGNVGFLRLSVGVSPSPRGWDSSEEGRAGSPGCRAAQAPIRGQHSGAGGERRSRAGRPP